MLNRSTPAPACANGRCLGAAKTETATAGQRPSRVSKCRQHLQRYPARAHQIGKNTTINEALDVYPEVSHLGEYRFALAISLASKIKGWLGWQTTISDRYISDPIPGTVRNDFIFSAGLNFTFTH